MTNEVHAVRAKAIEKIEVVHRQVGDIANAAGIVRRAKARMLRHANVIVRRQCVEERQPARKPACAMQKYQRLALAGTKKADGNIADLMQRLFLRPYSFQCHHPAKATTRALFRGRDLTGGRLLLGVEPVEDAARLDHAGVGIDVDLRRVRG